MVVAEAAPAALPIGRPKLLTWAPQVCNILAIYGMRAPSCLSFMPYAKHEGRSGPLPRVLSLIPRDTHALIDN